MSALAGIGMTIFSWYGPWEWPAWPAFATLRLVFGKGQDWVELPYNTRAAVLVGLIAINVGVWAAVAWIAAGRTRRVAPTTPPNGGGRCRVK